MGINVEFNPDLALRDFSEYKKGNRKLEEGRVYNFLKKDQRNYWLHGEQPLLETKGNGILSEPLASIIILEATHFLENEEVYTRGKYKVIKVLKEGEIYFNGINKIK
jgi:hypothetical protein